MVILMGLMLLMAPMSAGASMPPPGDGGVYPYTYLPVAAPVVSDDPAAARPLGVGSIAGNHDVLIMRIGFNPFADKVDIYVALRLPILDPHTYFLLRPDNSLQTLDQDLVAWRKGVHRPHR
jgi:hypothetical protein